MHTVCTAWPNNAKEERSAANESEKMQGGSDKTECEGEKGECMYD
jgi:hypothetical protein